MKSLLYIFVIIGVVILMACQQEKEHTAGAIYDRDSVSMMTTYGVNTLISDSGVMKYRIVAEEWEVNTVRNPSRWIFNKGIFMEQFDKAFHIEAYVQADTAFYYDQDQLWELRGNVRVRTVDGLRFASQELFWDQRAHEFYSNMFSHLITPEREMQGSYFRSDEQMTHYMVTNSKGSFASADVFGGEDEAGEGNGDKNASADTVVVPKRQATPPMRKRP